MKLPRRAFCKIGAGAVGIAYLSKGSAGQTKPHVQGTVLQKDDKPIASVLVTVYRRSIKIGEFTTKSDGEYLIEFESDSPIDTVWFKRTSYIDGVVNDLSGARDHYINKVLYPRGTPLNLFEGQEALSSLERIYYINIPKIPIQKLKAIYGPVLEEMRSYTLTNVPQTLRRRLFEVMRLYNLD